MNQAAFKYLTAEEFRRLPIDERMDYLQRAMVDLREKLEQTRQQAARLPNDKAAKTPAE